MFKIRCASVESFTHTEDTHKGASVHINFCIINYSAASFYHILNLHHMAYLDRLFKTCIFKHEVRVFDIQHAPTLTCVVQASG